MEPVCVTYGLQENYVTTPTYLTMQELEESSSLLVCSFISLLSFFISYTFFASLGIVCAIQLIMCCISEYQRLKAPTTLKACKITTQKLIYLVICFASLLRGAYFIFPVSIHFILKYIIKSKENYIIYWIRIKRTKQFPVAAILLSVLECAQRSLLVHVHSTQLPWIPDKLLLWQNIGF